jgi:DNA-binding beta-propeller fold protein YncE
MRSYQLGFVIVVVTATAALLSSCGGGTTGALALPPTIFIADAGRLVGVSDMMGTSWYLLNQSGPLSVITNVNHVTRDATGRFYVSEGLRIVRFDDLTGKNIAALSGFGGATGVAFDAQGRMYVADRGNYRIVRVDDMAGAGWVTYGSCCTGVGRFWDPIDVAVDGQGRIYVADMMNDRIVRINDMTGAGWVTFGTPGGAPGQLHWPWGVDVDGTGRIYIADSANGRIVRVDDMSGTNWIADAFFRSPWGVQVSPSGRIYAADRGESKIVRMDNMSGGGRIELRCDPRGPSGGNCFIGPEGVWGP